jgi:pyruvate/2-oxoglutarate dehydrogenase complex dihydrolipoamide dehydrogenase (E3) component
MERMRKIRAQVSKADSAERLAKDIGVDTFLGQATFTGPNEIMVNGQKLIFSKCCIATGARPYVPEYPGIQDVPHYSSENIFNLTE